MAMTIECQRWAEIHAETQLKRARRRSARPGGRFGLLLFVFPLLFFLDAI
jgi:hypothetical protein